MLNYNFRGRRRENPQPWYLLALLTPWTYWVPLAYTGVRIMAFDWIGAGLFYGLPVFVHFAINPAEYGFAEMFKYWEVSAWIAAGVHSFRARGEYLAQLAGVEGSGAAPVEALTEAPVEDVSPQMPDDRHDETPAAISAATGETSAWNGEQPLHAAKPAAVAYPRGPYDLNQITEEEIAMLPGMDEEFARQVIAMRKLLGGFQSFDHFADRMSLPNKVREKLWPLFMHAEGLESLGARVVEPGGANPSQPAAPARAPSRRIVDL